jgi:hypothetical protein
MANSCTTSNEQIGFSWRSAWGSQSGHFCSANSLHSGTYSQSPHCVCLPY